MQKIPSFLGVFGLLVTFVGCSTPKSLVNHPTNTTAFIGDSKIKRHIFDNGLRLAVVEQHDSPTFAYQTYFGVGSRNEVPGYTGLAHLFEHMMFKGTTRFPTGSLTKILEQNGAQGVNATTSQDRTNYIQELPNSKLDTIVMLEADRMVDLIIDKKSFETEREVVKNERRYRYENSPDGMMYQDLYTLLFKNLSYRWPVIGYEEDLDRMTEKNATDFYKLYYRPNNAMIVVVGDVNYDQVKSTIAKYYEKIPAQPIPATAIQPELPQVQASRKTLSLNTQVEKIVIAYKVPGDPMEVAPPFEVLASLLTAGRSARLPKLLVDSGLATSVESELVRGIDTSIFLIYATLQAKKKAAHAEAMILSELSAIAKGMISASELDRSKNQLVFSFYQSLSSNAAMARFIGTSEFVGKGVEAELQMVERARAVNINQIQKNVENFLKPTARTVIVGVPK